MVAPKPVGYWLSGRMITDRPRESARARENPSRRRQHQVAPGKLYPVYCKPGNRRSRGGRKVALGPFPGDGRRWSLLLEPSFVAEKWETVR